MLIKGKLKETNPPLLQFQWLKNNVTSCYSVQMLWLSVIEKFPTLRKKNMKEAYFDFDRYSIAEQNFKFGNNWWDQKERNSTYRKRRKK